MKHFFARLLGLCLLAQHLDYAALRPDAISAGLLRGQNDQLYDVPGRAQSPD